MELTKVDSIQPILLTRPMTWPNLHARMYNVYNGRCFNLLSIEIDISSEHVSFWNKYWKKIKKNLKNYSHVTTINYSFYKADKADSEIDDDRNCHLVILVAHASFLEGD